MCEKMLKVALWPWFKRSNDDYGEEENDGNGDADDNDVQVKEASYFIRRECSSIGEGTEKPEE